MKTTAEQIAFLEEHTSKKSSKWRERGAGIAL